MPITSAAGLSDAVRELRLLSPAQADELLRLHPTFPDARALARELLQRNWLTPYQLNQLVAGNGNGLVLGQYVLLERIGEGGMGQVLKARHQRLERIVALKLIRKDRVASPDALQRFQREARAAARLSHPNLVTVYDADEVAGTPFYAMEYVEGTDLAKLMRQRGPLPIAQACDYVRQAALGLQHAHEQGLVHRDIKPANLILTAQGLVKVLDLGLARLVDGPAEAMTREGAVLGTPDYMAPEQAMDLRSADRRADLYSLGCTHYYLLTGRVPFPGGTLTDKLLRHQMSPVPRVEAPGLDALPGVAEVVQRLMAKQPAERYQTAAELAAALAPFCGDGPPLAIPVGTTVPRGGGAQAEQNTQTTLGTLSPGQRAQVAREDTSLVKQQSWWRSLPAVCGGLILLVIVLVVAAWLVTRPPKTFLGPKSARWPLDNLQLFQAQKGIDAWPPKGLVLVLGGHGGRHWGPVRTVAYSPDGKFVASAGDDQRVCVWKTENLEEYRVLHGHVGAIHCLAFSPDGQQLLSGGADKTVRLWDVESGKERLRLDEHGNTVRCLAVSKDGKRALVGCDDFVVRLWDLETKKVQARFRRKENERPIAAVEFAPDGRHVFSATRADFTITRWDVQGRAPPRSFAGHSRFLSAVSFSRDGRALCAASSGSPRAQLWDAKSGTQLGALLDPVHSLSAAFSPTNSRVVLGVEGRGRVARILVWDAPSGGIVSRLEGHLGKVKALAVSPDGQRILSGSEDGTVRLWDVDSGKEVFARPGHTLAVNSVALSEDGRYAFTGGADKKVRRWDLTSDPPGQERAPFEGHTKAVRDVVLRADGAQVLSRGDDKTVRLWDVEAGKEIGRCDTVAMAMAFTTEGPRALDRLPRPGGLWDVAAGTRLLRAFDDSNFGQGGTTGVVISPDGRQAFAVHGAAASLWDMSTGKRLYSLRAQGARAPVVFSRNGKHVLSGSLDGAVRLWTVKDKVLSEPAGLAGHKSEITALAFTPDGRTAAASARDGKVIVWDLKDRQLRQDWQFPGPVQGLAFDEKGHHLATANGDGTVFFLRLDMVENGAD